MHGHRPHALPHGQVRQQVIVRPDGGVEHLDLVEARPGVLVERGGHVLGQAVGARARVDHHRQAPAVAPAQQRLGGVAGHVLLAAPVALRAPRRGAAVTGHVGRDPERPSRPAGHLHQRLGQRGLGRRVARVAEDPVHAGRQVHGRRAGRHRARQAGGGGGRHRVRVGGHEVVAHRAAQDLRGPAHGPVAHRPAHRVRGAQPSAGRPLHRRVALGHRQGHLLLPVGALLGAEGLHQLAGVDGHRAGVQAGAVRRAGLDGVVLVLAQQHLEHGGALRLARHLAPQDDALARRGGHVTAGAHGLAEAALHALRHHVLDRGRRLQVLHVHVRVAVQHHSRVERVVRVGQPLDAPHHLGGAGAPFALHVGGHVHPGAVLGLQGAVVAVHHQLHEVVHEGVVALTVGLVGEHRREHEVEVPGRGVAGHAGEEAVLAEQLAQVGGGLRYPRRREAHVLGDQGRARQPQLAHQPEEPLAHRPGQLHRVLLAGELGRAQEAVPGHDLLTPGHERVEPGVVVGPELHQQRRRVGGQLLPVLGGSGERVSGGDERRGHHQLHGPSARGHERVHGRHRRVDAREMEPRDRGLPWLGHGVEHRLGDEGERALGPHQQAAEDLQRRVGVEEGAEPVAGGVLDLELPPHAIGQLAVLPQLVAQLDQAARQLGLPAGELLLGTRSRGVDHGARGEHEGER